MSELTRCNHCTLQDMKRHAKKTGRSVFIVHERTGEWKGWTSAYYKGETQAAARFMKLTDHCVC